MPVVSGDLGCLGWTSPSSLDLPGFTNLLTHPMEHIPTPVAKPHGSDWIRALRPRSVRRYTQYGNELVGKSPLLGLGRCIL